MMSGNNRPPDKLTSQQKSQTKMSDNKKIRTQKSAPFW
jgi:hypothetical protein